MQKKFIFLIKIKLNFIILKSIVLNVNLIIMKNLHAKNIKNYIKKNFKTHNLKNIKQLIC